MGLDPGAIKARLSELKNNAKSSVGSLNETNKTQTQLELKRKKIAKYQQEKNTTTLGGQADDMLG